MDIASRKLSLIERVMRISKEGVLDQMEELLIAAEMESRTRESVEAISKGDVQSLEQFAQSNEQWRKKRATK
jgi:hypothetical protein